MKRHYSVTALARYTRAPYSLTVVSYRIAGISLLGVCRFIHADAVLLHRKVAAINTSTHMRNCTTSCGVQSLTTGRAPSKSQLCGDIHDSRRGSLKPHICGFYDWVGVMGGRQGEPDLQLTFRFFGEAFEGLSARENPLLDDDYPKSGWQGKKWGYMVREGVGEKERITWWDEGETQGVLDAGKELGVRDSYRIQRFVDGVL
jgi:hypothetical protein